MSHRPAWSVSALFALVLILLHGIGGVPPVPSDRGTPDGGRGDTVFPHDPVTWPLVSEQPFTTLDGSGWSNVPQAATAAVVSAPDEPTVARVGQAGVGDRTGTAAIEFRFPAKFPADGVAPATLRPPWPGPRREVYWALTWRLSPGFEGHPSGVNKLLYGWIGDNATFGLSYLWSRAGPHPGWDQQLGVFAGARYFLANEPACVDRTLPPGRWHRVELLVRPASRPGIADGRVVLWIDGVRCLWHDGVVMPAGLVTDTYLEPTWGGAGGTPLVHPQTLRIGHARLRAR